MSYTAYGQFGVDWDERIDFGRLRKERLERAKRSLKEHELDALIAFTPENVRYITGTASSLIARIVTGHCILPRDGEPLLYELGGDLGRQKQCAPWISGRTEVATPVRFVPQQIANKWALSIKKMLREMKIIDGKIGIDQTSFKLLKALQEAKINFTDGSQAMEDARMLKTRDELQCIKMSVMLVEPSFQFAQETIKPGVRECDVVAGMTRIDLSLGSTLAVGVVASGEHTHPYWRGFSNDKMIRPGDLVILDRAHMLNGYFCDVTRTFLCGSTPTEEQKEAYRTCYDLLYSAIKVTKPNNTTVDVAEKWKEAEAEDYSDFTLQFGHGMGLSVHEPPYIAPSLTLKPESHPVKLQPNMVMAFETYAGRGKHGVRLEENLIVTETGCEVISRYPFEKKLME